MVQTKMTALSVLLQTQKANKTLREGLPPPLLLQYPVNILAQQSELLRSTAEPARMGHSIAASSSLKVQHSGIEDCAARKQTLTNSYQVDHCNKSVHKDACTQQYKHSTYSISSPSIFEQKIARVFLTVPKPPLLTPTTDSRQKSAKIRSTRCFFASSIYKLGSKDAIVEDEMFSKDTTATSIPQQISTCSLDQLSHNQPQKMHENRNSTCKGSVTRR